MPCSAYRSDTGVHGKLAGQSNLGLDAGLFWCESFETLI